MLRDSSIFDRDLLESTVLDVFAMSVKVVSEKFHEYLFNYSPCDVEHPRLLGCNILEDMSL